MSKDHIPVLLEEVVELLALQPGDTVIDGTVGLGGHAQAMLERIKPNGKLLGIDRDRDNLNRAKQNLVAYAKQTTLVHDSFLNLKQIAYDCGYYPADAILLDLGFSSVHIQDSSRGFSFQSEGPLDMRYDQSQGQTAADIINNWSIDELAEIFRKLGEERHARKIAAAIVAARRHEPIQTTIDFANLIKKAIPTKRGKIHPATRVFQALRIAVNDELAVLEQALPKALGALKPGGRLAVISFHSLEDRIVKQLFKQFDKTKIKIITKRPVTATQEEIRKNPRCRSAKLRVAERLKLCSDFPDRKHV
ncbi:MAG: 16S rRNA (cytosine(1402)-N(4))-methyltransferase RsmH [Candidatus Uhrbacteria bacterium]